MSTSYTLRNTASSPRASSSGVGITVDVSQVTALAKALRRTAPEVWKVLRKEMRAMAEVVAKDARSRASFSSRIPGSIRVKGAGSSLRIVAGGDAAPDAAPIENKGKGHVRHPVFGHRDRFTDVNSPPAFLFPALNAHREELTVALTESIERAVNRGLSL